MQSGGGADRGAKLGWKKTATEEQFANPGRCFSHCYFAQSEASRNRLIISVVALVPRAGLGLRRAACVRAGTRFVRLREAACGRTPTRSVGLDFVCSYFAHTGGTAFRSTSSTASTAQYGAAQSITVFSRVLLRPQRLQGEIGESQNLRSLLFRCDERTRRSRKRRRRRGEGGGAGGAEGVGEGVGIGVGIGGGVGDAAGEGKGEGDVVGKGEGKGEGMGGRRGGGL